MISRICSWSGGKDSTATIILAHEHGIPIDEIVMAVLWFDKERGIPAILPSHWEFITKVAKPKFEEWGYKVTFVDAKYDYINIFNRIKTKSKYPERNGKKYGFLLSGFCAMTGEKQNCIKQIKKRYSDCIDFQGIAVDERERLNHLHKRTNAISLLEKYNMTEEQAKELCKKYGLLSPLYSSAFTRDGCWFCPNKRIAEKAYIKQNYPELWEELRKLSLEDNLVTDCFSYGKTFAEVDEQVDKYIHRPIQCSFF
ncbi:hypothetical protein [Sigmofec virus UA08Rod_5397]|uniref:Phosphoadenosine phosphosulfate reductase n=1 Tax=Sigmofec virus UA08Rod_5397 TaxID=2929423 RepID=A0A976N1U4_9VIRU|nr:hypothetical protein [Sigmofec virus UA08Rod_5397]